MATMTSDQLLPWHHDTWNAWLHATPSRDSMAWLLNTPDGHGAGRLLYEYVRHGLCEERPRACGHCRSCRMMAAGNHPDCAVIVPPARLNDDPWLQPWLTGAMAEQEEGGEGASDKQRSADTDAEPTSGRTVTSHSAGQDIRIDDIRRIQRLCTQTTLRAGWRFVVIWPAERLNVFAANALLKMLEEPHPGSCFLLLTHRVDAVLPTIRSRCMQRSLPAASATQARQWLMQQHGLSEPKAEQLLLLTGGAPIQAAGLIDHPEAGLATEWLSLLRSIAQSPPRANPGLVWVEAARFEGLGVPWALSLMQRQLQEGMVALAQAGSSTQRRQLQRLIKVDDHCRAARRWSHHPLNPRLVLEGLLHSWQDAWCH